MKKFIKNNLLLIISCLFMAIIECLAITYTACYPFLTGPWYTILILITIILIVSLISSQLWRLISLSFILFCQIILDTLFIFLYDSNGTVFEWAMFNQRTDAAGTLETIELQTSFMVSGFILLLVFIIVSIILLKKLNKLSWHRFKFINLSLIILLITFIITIPQEKKAGNYHDKLYSTTFNNYQTMGIIANAVWQIAQGETEVKLDKINQIENFIYQKPITHSKYHGISKNNNLILILVESFEWYPFTKYPELTNILFPNLSKLMKDGLIATQYYQKEKTDISEALAVLGNHPTGRYVSYDFPQNTYPFSLPNMLKANYPAMKINSFHANYGRFYNRYQLHQSWGFEQLYAIKEMKDYGVEDTWQHKNGERNLDSITFSKMKEVMFPTNEQYFSYILSFSMHGYYKKRTNLLPYYSILEANNLFTGKLTENEEYLATYMAALMDFDQAIGQMMKYLQDTKALNKTTIVLFSDHNTYYNKLSNYVKQIDTKYEPNLYNLPFVIYDKKLTQQYKEDYKTNEIKKFTTASDIVPTILDLYGIDGWQNMYLGHNLFANQEKSIIYSRNYGFFMTDKFMGYSLNTPLYQGKKFDKSDFEQRASTYLEQLEYIDQIYYSDYFKNHSFQYQLTTKTE